MQDAFRAEANSSPSEDDAQCVHQGMGCPKPQVLSTDYASFWGDELFTLYKERQEAVTQTAVAEKQDRKQAVKSASTGSARGSSEASPKKIYRRQDIIRLMKNDPDRYASLSQEILKAYEEKRVR